MNRDWTYCTLEEAAILKSGYTPSESELSAMGDIPYFKVGDMNAEDNQMYLQKTNLFLTSPCKSFPSASIVFPKNGAAIATNKKRILRYNSVVDLNTAILIPQDGYSSEFLYYWISHIDFRQITRRGAVPTLDLKELKQFKVPNISLGEQKSVVSELDLLTEIIDKQKQQLKELDKLAQSIFYDMFGDPIENEKGFTISTVGEISTDVSYGTSKPSSETGRYIYLRMNNITYDGGLDLNNIKYIDVDEDDFVKYSANEGDILFNRTNSAELVGKTTWFHGLPPMIIAGYIIRVKLRPSVLPVYFSSFMNSQEMKKVLKAMGKGAVNQSNINSKELKSITLPVPPLELQQSFARMIQSIESQKESINRSIAESQKLFDYTMDKYFG